MSQPLPLEGVEFLTYGPTKGSEEKCPGRYVQGQREPGRHPYLETELRRDKEIAWALHSEIREVCALCVRSEGGEKYCTGCECCRHSEKSVDY